MGKVVDMCIRSQRDGLTDMNDISYSVYYNMLTRDKNNAYN